MTDNIIPLRRGVPLGSADKPELEDIKLPKNNVWLSAAKAAVADKALWGAVLYVTDEGDLCVIPIKADRTAFRGLLEESLEDLKAWGRSV